MGVDRIEKEALLSASRARVWRALTDAAEFGSWFGMKLDSPFVAGARVTGIIVPTRADPAVAEGMKPFEGLPVELWIERMEPERLFSFRWHPFAIDRGTDYSREPTTVVTFELGEAAEGVALAITESGFDALPEPRRAAALVANEGGWSAQLQLIAKHLAQAP